MLECRRRHGRRAITGRLNNFSVKLGGAICCGFDFSAIVRPIQPSRKYSGSRTNGRQALHRPTGLTAIRPTAIEAVMRCPDGVLDGCRFPLFVTASMHLPSPSLRQSLPPTCGLSDAAELGLRAKLLTHGWRSLLFRSTGVTSSATGIQYPSVLLNYRERQPPTAAFLRCLE
jgi:hypothetical protein